MYGDLGLCSSPCIKRISLLEYRKQISKIKDFLNGKSNKITSDLEAEMLKASKSQKYEEAKEWIAKALGREDESAVVVEHYGDVLWKLGEEKEAVKYWERAIKLGEGSEFLERKVQEKTYIDF